jgi:hypothetical protein
MTLGICSPISARMNIKAHNLWNVPKSSGVSPKMSGSTICDSVKIAIGVVV